MLVVVGGAILLLGFVILLVGKTGFRLPGDILIRRGGLTIYLPIVTFLAPSLLLTILLNLIFRFLR